MRTYHCHEIGVNVRMPSMNRMPATMPTSAARGPIRVVKVPSRNVPSSTPLVNEAMPSTSSTTRVDSSMAAMATPSWTTPQPTVAQRETAR